MALCGPAGTQRPSIASRSMCGAGSGRAVFETATRAPGAGRTPTAARKPSSSTPFHLRTVLTYIQYNGADPRGL